jgi:protein-L-isoaspartate(D-aspartate) O-methyltransferase
MKQPRGRIATLLRDACRSPTTVRPRRPRSGPAAARAALALLMLAALPGGVAAAAEEDVARARARMIEVIERHARHATEALGGDEIDPAVIAVMADLPRHEFVPADQRAYAYDDRPLPIGYGQTISQPFIVALMTAMAEVGKGDVVLEVGTGSGYQAAVLARLAAEVHTIEIVPGLAASARERLARLGLANLESYEGDGYYGLAEAAPFDAIVVTAAASHVPPPLIAQLKPGGRMVIPVGGGFSLQQLMLIEKDAAGRVHSRQTLPVAFVPLTRGS